MDVVETIEQVRRRIRLARNAGKAVGFVPTMGALHQGHASLIDAARACCEFVAVSIFVNPTQFAPNEDLSKYPRTPQADMELCREHGADLVFMPSVDEIYGCGSLTDVRVESLSRTLCGASRSGHFDGVCVVMAKLFNIVAPDKVFFGAKDFQQAAIIKRMVADLNFPVEIVVCPTVREADGLAMSSRNRYLTPAQRVQAPALHDSLALAAGMIRSRRTKDGGLETREVVAAIRRNLAARAPEGTIDYVSIVDPRTLADVQTITGPVLIALAVKLGAARLIDNMLVDGLEGGT